MSVAAVPVTQNIGVGTNRFTKEWMSLVGQLSLSDGRMFVFGRQNTEVVVFSLSRQSSGYVFSEMGTVPLFEVRPYVCGCHPDRVVFYTGANELQSYPQQYQGQRVWLTPSTRGLGACHYATIHPNISIRHKIHHNTDCVNNFASHPSTLSQN